MQVTESYIANQLTNDINTSSSNYNAADAELATGLSLSEDSDNPSNANQAMTINSIMVDLNQYQADTTSATNTLQYTDSQLNAVDGLITQARTIGVAAASTGTSNTTSLQADAAQIQDIIGQLTTLANSQYNNQYIFSGSATNTAPFTPGDTTFTYNGNDDAMTTTIGNNTTMQTNIPGDQLFSATFAALSQLSADITSGDGTAISNDVTSLDGGLNTINQARATIGVSVDQLQANTANLTTAQANYSNSLGPLEDADVATTYTQLETAQTVYQASLEAVSKAMEYSLADYL